MVAEVLAASPYGVCGIARSFAECDVAHFAFIVLWLIDDIRRTVFWNGKIRNRNCAEELFTDSAEYVSLAVPVLLRVRLCDGNRFTFCMGILVNSSATIEANVPMSVAVALPLCADICVNAIGIVVTLLEALLVGIAPMFHELAAFYAKLVCTAYRFCVSLAASNAEFAFVATVTAFEAVATLVADKVVAVVFERAVVRTVIVFAVIAFSTTLALAAELAKFVWIEAVAAVCAKMLFPFVSFRTESVLAVIVALTIFA